MPIVPTRREGFFLNNKNLSTIEGYITWVYLLLGVRFLFWFYILTYQNSKPKDQQKDTDH